MVIVVIVVTNTEATVETFQVQFGSDLYTPT